MRDPDAVARAVSRARWAETVLLGIFLAGYALGSARVEHYAVAALVVLHGLTHRLSAQAARMIRLVERDPLTGLHTRRAFRRWIEEEFSVRRRSRLPHEVAVGILDLNYFKATNDTHGHEAGDSTLSMVARVLSRELRGGDRVARIGGDEFAVILRVSSKVEGRRAIQRLALAVGDEYAPGISFGVAGTWDIEVHKFDHPGASDETVLMKVADQRMYEHKRDGE